VAGLPAPLPPFRKEILGPPRQRLPAVTCSRNRLDQIALRSQLDTGLCEVKARGEYRVSLPTPVTQPRLAHDWRGFFVKCAFTPAASFFANAVMAASRVAA
jgi:hypothetical protein